MHDRESPARAEARAPSAGLRAWQRAVALAHRRRWLSLAVALLTLAALIAGQAALRAGHESRTWRAWYAAEEVPEIRLRLSDDARAALARRPRELVRAIFEHDGELRVVGLRLKGHRSMRPLAEKAAFKVAFDHYDSAQRFHGVRRLTLNNMVEDPTLLREFLGYRVFREVGVTSPRVAYARVYVDGEPRGLYSIVEEIDDLVERSTAGRRGAVVYEGEYGCDVRPEDVLGFDKDYGKDPGRAALAAFAEAAGGDARALFGVDSSPLDRPAFLAFLAASALVGDFDGYRHSHNYRVFFDVAARRWQLLPWGLDRAFQRPIEIYDSQGWLAKRCFRDPVCRLEYVRTLRAVTNRFESLRLDETAKALAKRLDALGPEAANQAPKAARTAAARLELEAFIRERPTQVEQQLACIDESGNERDRDGDGQGCMDCNDLDPLVGPHAAERCDGIDNDCSGLVDDAPACACAQRELLGRTYHFCNLPMPWDEAAASCEAKGLVLARVDSKRLSRELYRAANGVARLAWWIGYSDREEEGRFRWREGDDGGFAFWDAKQPNDKSCNEDCVALREGRKGRWHDTSCHHHRPFICAARAAPEGVRTIEAAAEKPSDSVN